MTYKNDTNTPLTTSTHTADEYLVFTLASQKKFALKYTYIDGVIKANSICPVPETSRMVCGVVSWRGRLITVFDLNYLILKNDSSAPLAGWIIVVKDEGGLYGLLIDDVVSSADYSLDPLATTVSSTTTVAEIPYMKGQLTDKIAILDLASLAAQMNKAILDDTARSE